MTSTPNDSFNTSDQLMDLSLKNFWVIVHYPCSDPECEYEIVGKKDLVFDSWEVLERGAVVTVKYGNARVQGIVVTVSDDYNLLSANLEDYIQEYKEIKFEESRSSYEKRGNFRHVIKIADKETQTDFCDVENATLKRQYEELQNKYNDLKLAVTDVKAELKTTILKLDVEGTFKTPLQPLNDNKENSKQMVQIGSGGTKIPRQVYNSIKWASYSAATRKLLITLFPRSVLATHSLTGKPSPAFISSNKQTKMRLNPTIISDIIEIVMKKCLVSEPLVRNAITTKCADENKMYKKRLERQQVESDDENNVKKVKLN
ncbi:hypothetical protein TcasGA2_TC005343 [Tribolium castaneum]|uniref:BEN domain-containing protein n=1 Tax=Tribolium castaneum TaxID=7070 RepID=D6WUW0_TRICA|nr:PREDICTED: early boundary activity protein 2 [Tribolium castaneum]EFA07785.1 hypothetical protein TcasGA2_TC005343 [Tribolium castaneum]|eukprot:XP_008197449.1 PREDICTED: early boundary activity protein 2 [Tribolium castaneum]